MTIGAEPAEKWQAMLEPGVDGAWEVGYTSKRGLNVLIAYGLTKDIADLIAAAPDMLKALTAAKIMLKNRDQDPNEAKVLAYISMVIAQAEGQT